MKLITGNQQRKSMKSIPDSLGKKINKTKKDQQKDKVLDKLTKGKKEKT